MSMSDALYSELEQEAATTRRMLERVPGDQLGWRPHPRSRTLGQLAMHVAGVPGALAELSHLDTFQFENGPPEVDPGNVKEILDAFDTSMARAKEHLGRMDDRKIMETWTGTLGGKPVFAVPRIGLLRAIMLNHTYHHRGQLSVYLRELNVPVPSIYGPSADENPFAMATEAMRA
ncbi:MAG: DinB family protein [Candidatus Eisenbacteria bacterium]|uniref:DinB family protein n=1 Tax=Eiseniibacteriota bacterium TaxID=2212470 RepID=A0A849SL37_UNCEI|nr:DinB family protein [Candidatus Eisenbacteria bacterium]